MAETAVVTPAASAPATNVKDTQEYKDQLAQDRERMRADFDAEYRRKEKELLGQVEARSAHAAAPQADFFETWGERHGLPANAGKELAEGIVAHIQGVSIPTAIKPLTASAKRQELRSQRAEVRSNPKLAKMDDRFHGDVLKLLDPLDPSQVGPESYARALQMVIGQNIEALETEFGKAEGDEGRREAERAPGAEPLPSSGPSGSGPKVVLTAYQQAFCEDKGFTSEEFVDMMRTRARKMEESGMQKPEIRKRLGQLLSNIEF